MRRNKKTVSTSLITLLEWKQRYQIHVPNWQLQFIGFKNRSGVNAFRWRTKSSNKNQENFFAPVQSQEAGEVGIQNFYVVRQRKWNCSSNRVLLGENWRNSINEWTVKFHISRCETVSSGPSPQKLQNVFRQLVQFNSVVSRIETQGHFVCMYIPTASHSFTQVSFWPSYQEKPRFRRYVWKIS